MNNESINPDTILSKNEHIGPLKLGKNIHDIIERIQSLNQYKTIYARYIKLNDSFKTLGTLTLILCSVMIGSYMGIVCGGVPFLLKRKRLISDLISRRVTRHSDPREPVNISDQPHYHLRRPTSIQRTDTIAPWVISSIELPTVSISTPPSRLMSTPSAV